MVTPTQLYQYQDKEASMLLCEQHLREVSTILFVAVYLPPQNKAGTKTSLKAISKEENAHPEAALLVAGDFNAGKLKSVLSNFYQHVICATREENNPRPTLHHT